MRARIVFAMAFLFVLLPGVASAQTVPNLWYFATLGNNPASTQLVAYNPYSEGTVNTLLKSGVDTTKDVRGIPSIYG
jgi:hypothetical protein